MTSPDRIAVVGAGHVGATTAYALMLRALFREIVLIDQDVALAAAEAADLRDANALARPARIWAGSYADAATANLVVITAGAATHGAESRTSVASQSGAIVAQCVTDLREVGFNGVILVATNPVDAMSLLAFRNSGLPALQVIGTGTLLDTSRLHQELAEVLGVSPGSVNGLVLGEHGDSEVVAFSGLQIGGGSLAGFVAPGQEPDHAAIAAKVRTAAYEIIAAKGYTSYGVATAIVRICEAIVRNERAVLPVSTFLTGEFGIEDVYLSLPCVVGARGILKVLSPQLSEPEVAALRASADAVRKTFAAI